MTLAPGTKLGPYEIIAPIGSGGMGEVWKARDTRLGRIVAIKKVKEQHSERFKQEARSIAALNHPYICQIHDIGPDYLVLEYVEGKPLSCPIPEKEAVRFAIQIAAALEEAHRNGIIHRDLKPSNIMVTDKDSIKLLDFGLAKLCEQDASVSTSPTADLPATQAGAVLGTVAYMSPEQAQGQPADARSDIFSFGLVLYEMLSGRRAFSGDNSLAILSAIQNTEPLPLQASSSLEKIVRHCLAKRPAERFQSMTEVRDALENTEAKPAEQQQPSIAVLPFVNMSGDKEQEYFSDGLAEEIINALTQIPGLKVIARTSAFAFKGKQEDITKIAEALRVSTILEGSVRKAGNRIRITAQLVNAADGYHLWSERYDREMTDVFAIQDEIAQVIVGKLRVGIGQGRRTGRRPTEDMEAYNLYLQGRYFLSKWTPEGFAKARPCFEQAIARDPGFALAYDALSEFYWYLGFFGIMPPKEAFSTGIWAALRAVEIDDTLAETHALIGMYRKELDFNWAEVRREMTRARELNPSSPTVRVRNVLSGLMPLGRLKESVEEMKLVIESDPLSLFNRFWLVAMYCFARDDARASEQVRFMIEIDPAYWMGHWGAGLVSLTRGTADEAVIDFRKAAELSGNVPLVLGWLGMALALAGQNAEAQTLLDRLSEISKVAYVPPSCFAWIHLGLGDVDDAFSWMDRAIDARDPMMMPIKSFSFLEPLRSHPRYHSLLRKMNLEA